MSKSQNQAIDRIRNTITRHFTKHDVETYGAEITKFEISDIGYGTVAITVETKLTKANPNSLLSMLSHEHWLFFVTKRGAVSVAMAPKSWKQFAGQRAFGFNVRKDCCF